MSRVKEHYDSVVVPKLIEEFKYTSRMQVPKLEKIVVNTGVGEVITNSKAMEFAQLAMTQITGQKPSVRKARISIATFKLRKGMPIGCMVTLRGERMYSFFDRLVAVAMPRVRDFRGIPRKGFDGHGNYTMGIKEQIVFPEIEVDKLDRVRGMNITFVTSARNDEEGKALLGYLGLPFRK